MPSPVVAPSGSGRAGKRGLTRADLLAIVAIVSVVALIDSELAAYGLPGIFIASDLFHLPKAIAYGAAALLGVVCIWLSVQLARQIWKVEHALEPTPDPR